MHLIRSWEGSGSPKTFPKSVQQQAVVPLAQDPVPSLVPRAVPAGCNISCKNNVDGNDEDNDNNSNNDNDNDYKLRENATHRVSVPPRSLFGGIELGNGC